MSRDRFVSRRSRAFPPLVPTNKYPWTWRAAACNAFLLASGKIEANFCQQPSFVIHLASFQLGYPCREWRGKIRARNKFVVGFFRKILEKRKKKRKERKKKALSLRFVCPLAYNRSAKRYSRDVVKKREEKKKVTLGRPWYLPEMSLATLSMGTLESHTAYTNAF